jgi:hypothetical protein
MGVALLGSGKDWNQDVEHDVYGNAEDSDDVKRDREEKLKEKEKKEGKVNGKWKGAEGARAKARMKLGIKTDSKWVSAMDVKTRVSELAFEHIRNSRDQREQAIADAQRHYGLQREELQAHTQAQNKAAAAAAVAAGRREAAAHADGETVGVEVSTDPHDGSLSGACGSGAAGQSLGSSPGEGEGDAQGYGIEYEGCVGGLHKQRRVPNALEGRPGTGKKYCPHCNSVQSANARVCKNCSHTFNIARTSSSYRDGIMIRKQMLAAGLAVGGEGEGGGGGGTSPSGGYALPLAALGGMSSGGNSPCGAGASGAGASGAGASGAGASGAGAVRAVAHAVGDQPPPKPKHFTNAYMFFVKEVRL